MKLIIFGTGVFLKTRIGQLSNHDIVAYIDNDCRKWGEKFDGVQIYSPESIHQFQYDRILLMSAKSNEMKEQLLNSLKIPREKIIRWNELLGFEDRYHLEVYYPNNMKDTNNEQKILIITTELDYNGGSLAAVYAAMALRMRGYQTCIAAPGGNCLLIKEINNQSIPVILYKNLYFCTREELSWTQQFIYVIVNTLQMIHMSSLMKLTNPVLWWIHEPIGLYEGILDLDKEILTEDITNVDIYAVSNKAKNNFEKYFSHPKPKMLRYGIPDNTYNRKAETVNKTKIIFAVIGNVCECKAQDIFCEAILQLEGTEMEKMEFWFIGALNKETSFYINFIKKMEAMTNVKFFGCLTRKEMNDIYQQIDVVVCPSREETMSIVVTEGFMYGKVCIASNRTGIAAYIEEYKNGLICQAEDAISLRDQMRWVLEHEACLDDIRKKARETYEKHFSMEAFGERLENALLTDKK